MRGLGVSARASMAAAATPAKPLINTRRLIFALAYEFGRQRTDAPNRSTFARRLQGLDPERHLMEQLGYNLLFRWFVGLSPDDRVCVIGRPGAPSARARCS